MKRFLGKALGTWWVPVLGAMLLVAPIQGAQAEDTVRINEFVASNGSTIADEDGDYEDWIELFNAGDTAADLGGWGLSDDLSTPFRWVFPALTLEPGAFLVVWASGKDRTDPDGPLHTNFSISSGGEPLELTRPDGVTADFVPATPLPRDISFGRSAGDPEVWLYFDEPTPGAPNSTAGYGEILDQPVFSHPGGFYAAGLTVSIEAPDPSATVLYTDDGSEPLPDGPDITVYSFKQSYPNEVGDPFGDFFEGTMETLQYASPLAIEDRSPEPDRLTHIATTFHQSPDRYVPDEPVFKGTVIRARAVKAGALPSEVVTHTYFVTPEGAERYSLPVFAITISEDGLFDYYDGIYVAGRRFDRWREQNPDNPSPSVSREANYNRRGAASERPAHIEFFDGGETPALRQALGLRIHGGSSRSHPNKSLRLYPRSRYGSDLLEYPFFGELRNRTSGLPISGFHHLLLRSSGSDSAKDRLNHAGISGTRLRDGFVQTLLKPFGLDDQAFAPAIHFINGEFWGLTNMRERVSQHTLAARYELDPSAITVLENDGILAEGAPQGAVDWAELQEFVANRDLSVPIHFEHVAARVDIDNFVRYQVAQIYSQNTDWPGNNLKFWRYGDEPRTDQPHRWDDGRWRYFLFDLDFAFGPPTSLSYQHNTLQFATAEGGTSWPNPDWSTLMLRTLLENEYVRDLFINTMADHINTTFQPHRVDAVLDGISALISPYLPEHSARWTNTGDTDPGFIKTFGAERPGYVRQHVVDFFDLEGVAEITVDVAEPGQGAFRINSIVIDGDTPGIDHPDAPFPWTGNYFTDVPIEIEALPAPGYRFGGWGDNAQAKPVRTVTLSADESLAFSASFEALEAPLLMHYWDFNDEDPALSPAFTVGDGVKTPLLDGDSEIEFGSGQGFTGINARLKAGPGAHLRVNHPLDAVLYLALPTTNYESVVLRYEARRSGQAAGTAVVSYTVDGENFYPFETIALSSDGPALFEHDFHNVPGVDDNPLFAVRIEALQGSGGTAGNHRYNNVSLDGSPIPGRPHAPRATGAVTRVELIAGSTPAAISLDDLFFSPGNGDLSHSVGVDRPQVMSAEVVNGALSLSPLSQGHANVTVTASNGLGDEASATFYALVYPAAFPLAEGAFAFDFWSADAPEGSYPPHMLFLQSSEDEPGQQAPLEFAYHLEVDDYHEDDVETMGFPYNNTRRTRINGLGTAGISFINTGQGRELGGALLALDTTGVPVPEVSWDWGTVEPNSRIYALRLQYRTAVTAPFQDVLVAGMPVEYLRAASEELNAAGPLVLPEELGNRSYVQLLWRYHHVAGNDGPRAELSLGNVAVAGEVFLEGEGDGGVEGEGFHGVEGEAVPGTPYSHSADRNGDGILDLSELLRVIQFFNEGAHHCADGTEDGYAPGPGPETCAHHSSDYNPADWRISLSELLRAIQFFNSAGYYACPEEDTEDGYCLVPVTKH